MEKNQIGRLTLPALMTAVTVMLSQISIPLTGGIPLTLQTFAMALCGYLLGKRGAVPVLVYLGLGLAGLPVFTGFGSGLGTLTGVTGGFLYGFVPLAWLCGVGAAKENRIIPLGLGGLGVLVCHGLGLLQFAGVSGRSLAESFWIAGFPFLLKDMISVFLAYVFTLGLKRRLKRIPL